MSPRSRPRSFSGTASFSKNGSTTLFAGYRPPKCTQQWDIPAGADTQHDGVPVKPKAIKYAARAAAQEIKHAPPFTTAVIAVNPKIGSKTQRRLKCSLRFDEVFKHRAPDAAPRPQECATLRGVNFSASVNSRTRNTMRYAVMAAGKFPTRF